MATFNVYANNVDFGNYEAASSTEACEMAARDAGYESVRDMVERLGCDSELQAVEI